jgi:8-oxo-dGTP diphosphatase
MRTGRCAVRHDADRLAINTSFAMLPHAFVTTFPHGLFMQIGDNSARRLLVVAAAALLDGQGRVLLAQRPAGKTFAGLWEFPGGKLEPGEGPEVALARELKEELDVDVQTQDMAPFAFASHGYADFHLMMPLYVVRRWSGVPRAVEGGAVAWFTIAALSEFNMPPADAPLVAELQKRGLVQ